MAVISRNCPGWVRQSLENSCWAAVLESWSRADPRMPRLRQQSLIQRWGEGATGSITPVTKIPQITAAYGLRYDVLASGQLVPYIRSHLASSYLFCAYTLPGSWTHAVLVYRIRDRDVAFMDPDPGRYRVESLHWMDLQQPFLLMRRP